MQQNSVDTKQKQHSATKRAGKLTLSTTLFLRDRESQFQQMIGNHGMLRRREPVIQPKLTMCTDDDKYEQRDTARSDTTPPNIIRAMSRPGSPLESGLKQEMEQLFGYDFTGVRVHRDGEAAHRTRRQRAQALTVGNNIFFSNGAYAPEIAGGRWLLAHELAHVVQQAQGSKSFQGLNEYAEANDAKTLETEADRCASRAARGESAAVRGRTQEAPQAYPMCERILASSEEKVVGEHDVQRELNDQFKKKFPMVEREFPIPAGSFGPWRTEDPKRLKEIKPQTFTFRRGDRTGEGQADFALLPSQSRDLELPEVKRGDGLLVADAVQQLDNYVIKANQDIRSIRENWAERRGIKTKSAKFTHVVAMPTSRLAIPSPMRIKTIPTSISWCRDGVIAFKAIGAQDPKIFVCGSKLKSPEQFIDSLLSSAEIVVDRYIDQQLVPRIDKAVKYITLREAFHRMLTDPSFKQILHELLGSSANIAVLQTVLLNELERLLQGKADRILRIAIKSMQSHVVAEVRRTVKKQIRNALRSALNTLCATATELTAGEVLRELDRQMTQLVALAIPVAAIAVVNAVVAELAETVVEALSEAVKYLAIAVGVVIAAIALWKVAEAIAAGAALAEIGTAMTTFFAQLARSLAPLVFA